MQRQKKLSNLCRHHQVQALYALGSRAKVLACIDGDASHFSAGSSDIDIGIKTGFTQKWDVKQKALFAIALEDADPFLAARFIKGERSFAEDDYEEDEFDLFVLRRAGDLLPSERERLELILRGNK